jgi:competence protein ComEC
VTSALSMLAGVLLGLGAASTPAPWWSVASLGMLAVWFLSPWRRIAGLRVCAMLLMGLLLASQHVEQWRERRLTLDGADARVLVDVRIVSVPARDGATLHFDIEDERRRRLRIQWRDPHADPRAGERWRLALRQLPLEETVNFRGFDTARLAFRDGVHGAARVIDSRLNAPIEMAAQSVHTVRARIAARIRDAVADPDAAALITGLAVGLTGEMSAEQWRVFNATGTTHLVAISGLHVTMFSWLAYRVARRAWRCLPGKRLEREPFALLCGLAAASGYSMLAGFPVPTQRTWLMLAVYVLARLLCRCVGAARLWSLALMAVLLSDPAAPLSAGFWLSFAAVGALLMFAGVSPRDPPATRWWPLVRVQFIVMLAIAPLTLAVFGGLSLVGLLVNLVAIPVVSLLFVPGVLAGALSCCFEPAVGAVFFGIAATLHGLLWPALAWCADLELALWTASPPAWWFVAALPAVFVWLCGWPWSLRLTAIAIVPLLFAKPQSLQEGRAEVHVLDAGRGTAVLVRTGSGLLLFDTGDSWGTRGARLRDIVLPAMESMAARIDLLLLPTLDDDRAKAAAMLVLDGRVDRILVGGGWPGSRLPVERCRDARLRWGEVEIAIFEDAEGHACLMRASVGGTSLLLSGDLDAGGERRLLERVSAGPLDSDALVVGRRASASASTRRWIESTSPGLVIATGGITHARSRIEVLARWRRRADQVVDTRRVGGIVLLLSADGVTLSAVARDARYPFAWRRP